MKTAFFTISLVTAALTGCATDTSMTRMAPAAPFMQSALPSAVQVPAGNVIAMETVAKGTITYQCRIKPDTADQGAWVFVGPVATLANRGGAAVGNYFGPPATWVSIDGSSVAGAQLAVAPNGAANIPLQLVKANAYKGAGVMQNVTYIQRVATVGGVAPTTPCTVASLGNNATVTYQSDYIFWKAQ